MKPVTFNDIIVNALDETGLWARADGSPTGEYVETAKTLLDRRLNEYSNSNFLSFTRKEIDFKPQKQVIKIGEYRLKEDKENNTLMLETESERPDPNELTPGTFVYVKDNKAGYRVDAVNSQANAYISIPNATETWFVDVPDIEVQNLQEVVRAYCKISGANEWDELNFVAYEDFYNFRELYSIYSIKPVSDAIVELYLPNGLMNYTIKIIYNEFYEYELDQPLRIPGQFISLFTAGLAYDLARTYPRLSDSTVALMKERLKELEENCRRSSSVNKFISRRYDRNRLNYDTFATGKFLGI